jgi:uncharacterized RDD family membrane protein YckC
MFCAKCGAQVAEGVALCPACGQPVGGSGVAGSVAGAAARRFAYAGFWLRFVAVVIDFVILSVAMGVPFAIIFGGMFSASRGINPPDVMAGAAGTVVLFELVGVVVQWFYFALMESSAWQATLGKKALGLEVVDLEGRRVSFGRATGRYFAKIISGMILGIGYFMAGFTEKKQALHDMIAGSLVIKKL